MPVRVLIAEDHAVVREGLRLLLMQDTEIEIVGEAADGLQALRLARELLPDVVLMDLLMPNMDGFSATAAIRRELPDTEVLVLTSVSDDAPIMEALRAGAIGYLDKNTEVPYLLEAVHGAAAGQVRLSPHIAARLMRRMRTRPEADPLTERELDVLRLLARGLANKEIARTLQMGQTTVKTHVSNILSKLGLTSRTQAALYALREGLVRSDSPPTT